MINIGLSHEIAYRHEQLHRTAARRPAEHRARRVRSWFARRRTGAEVSTPAAELAVAAPAVGTPEFHEWATAVGRQFAERGVVAVKGQLDTLTQLAQRHGVAAVSRSVLADRREQEVARARAFLRVVAALEQLTPVSASAVDAAA
jgi:hypothetical protein